MKFFQRYSKWIIAFIFACAVIFVYKMFDNIAEILSGIGTVVSALKPFFVGFIIAYILNMIARRLDVLLKKCRNKTMTEHSYGISVAVSYIAAVVFVVILIAAILPALYKNILEIYSALPSYIRSLEDYINEFLKTFRLIGDEGIDIYSEFSRAISKVDIAEFGKYAQGVFTVTSGVFDVFIAIVSSVYMLLDKERLLGYGTKIIRFIFKKETADAIVSHALKINEIFINYIYSRLICGIITGILSGIALTVLQVKYALLLAILIALFDMIPYFGSIISFAVSVLVSIFTVGIWRSIWTAIILFVLQQIDGNVLAPKIMGDNLEIRPIWVIFAVSFGGSLFGFWGMVLSVPVVAAIKAGYLDYTQARENKKDNSQTDIENTDNDKRT